MNLIIPQGYQSALDIRETEVAIKKVKDFFEKALAAKMCIRDRVLRERVTSEDLVQQQ